jgi:hypothetical protein
MIKGKRAAKKRAAKLYNFAALTKVDFINY